MLNESIRYQNGALFCDSIPITEIITQVGTPVYIYSLRRARHNLEQIRTAFQALNPHIHYSAKANSNLAVLKSLVQAGAGIDAVSAGEIHRALLAGVDAKNIVFAGVGKTPSEIAYALKQNVGWFNVENIAECQYINDAVAAGNHAPAQIALRFNPEVTANTHPYISTGHGGAKFGLTAETIRYLLAQQTDYPHLKFSGIHLHIGSQLHDTDATRQAVLAALELIAPYPNIRTVNIGGGLPVAYKPDEQIPSFESFAEILTPLLKGYEVLLEPGRSIIADAGILVGTVLYIKRQAGQIFYIADTSMAELIRPPLYDAHHEIVPVVLPESLPTIPQGEGDLLVNVVGPVCESSDVLGRSVPLPEMSPSAPLAILTAGAYGMAMASNYNQRPRPPEVVVSEDGEKWQIARRRETWDDMLQAEVNL